MKFKIGDRIIGTEKYEGNKKIIKTTGRIISQLSDNLYCIEYDKDVGGHRGGSYDINTKKCATGKYGHCWNTTVECFKLFNKNRRMD